jgi:hydrogenase maturation factor
MSILADDRPDLLFCLTDQERQEIRGWKSSLSVIPEAALIRDLVFYLHDPTEGGLWGGIAELEHVCGRPIRVERDKVPLSDLTRKAAQELAFDPCRLISSGVLLAVLPREHVQEALRRLDEAHIPAAVIGEIGEDVQSVAEGCQFIGECQLIGEGCQSSERNQPSEELWRLLRLVRRK